MTFDREITACPECDSAHVRPRRPDHPGSHVEGQRDWYCGDCGDRFDEPVRRQARAGVGYAEDTSQRALLEADPEEVLG